MKLDVAEVAIYDHAREQLLHVRALCYSVLVVAAVLGYAALSQPPRSIDAIKSLRNLTVRYEMLLQNVAGKPAGEIFEPCRKEIGARVLPRLRREGIHIDTSFDDLGCYLKWTSPRTIAQTPTVADAAGLLGVAQSFDLLVPDNLELDGPAVKSWAKQRRILVVGFSGTSPEEGRLASGTIRLRDGASLEEFRDFAATWKWKTVKVFHQAYFPLNSDEALRYYWGEVRAVGLYETVSWMQSRFSFPASAQEAEISGVQVAPKHLVFIGPALIALSLAYLLAHVKNLLRVTVSTPRGLATKVASMSPWLGAADGNWPKIVSAAQLVLPALVVFPSVWKLHGSWQAAAAWSLVCLWFGVSAARAGAKLALRFVVSRET